MYILKLNREIGSFPPGTKPHLRKSIPSTYTRGNIHKSIIVIKGVPQACSKPKRHHSWQQRLASSIFRFFSFFFFSIFSVVGLHREALELFFSSKRDQRHFGLIFFSLFKQTKTTLSWIIYFNLSKTASF